MSNARLINGKTFSDILKQLREPKSPDKKLLNKYPYYKIDTFYERVNSVIGVEHYSVEYSDQKFYTVGSGQEIMTCKCRITILDDDFQPVLFKEAYGGREIHYSNTTEIDDGIKNLASNAASAAFKEVWKSFGIFGLRPGDQSEEDNSSRTHATGKANNSQASQQGTGENDYQTYLLVGKTNVTVERTDTRTNKEVYKYRCKDKATKAEYDVIFYPNKYQKVEEKLKSMIACAEKGPLQLSIKAKPLSSRDGVTQLVFDEFVA